MRLRNLRRVSPLDANAGPATVSVVAMVLCFLAGAPLAMAAAPAPDPAPQATQAGSGQAPNPDPAPQAPTQQSTPPAAPSTSVTVLPHPSTGEVAVAPPSSSQPHATTTTATAPVIHAAKPAHAARPAARSGRRRGHRHVAPPPKRPPKPASHPRVITFQPTPAPRASGSTRSGMLLLFGAGAMFVLALASASMLRLLRRMGGAAL
jgi:hypothetical protein